MNYEHAILAVAVIGVLYLLLHGAATAEDLEAARGEVRALAESFAASLARIEKALRPEARRGEGPDTDDRGHAESPDRGRAEGGGPGDGGRRG